MELIPLLCLLFPWFGVTSAQEMRYVNVPEGDDVRLDCTLNSGRSINTFDWRKDNGEDNNPVVFEYKDGSYHGHDLTGQDEQFKRRVDFFKDELKSGNASIIIRNTRLEDNGTYTCGLNVRHGRVSIRLNVDCVLKPRNATGAARIPYIQTINANPTWSLLECKAQGVPKPEVKWINSAGEELPNDIQESKNGQSLKLKVTRSGMYTCVVTQQAICHLINNTIEVYIQEPSRGMAISLPGLLAIIFGVLGLGFIIGVIFIKIRQKQGGCLNGHTQVPSG